MSILRSALLSTMRSAKLVDESRNSLSVWNPSMEYAPLLQLRSSNEELSKIRIPSDMLSRNGTRRISPIVYGTGPRTADCPSEGSGADLWISFHRK
eukprot:scaffold44_cov411-Prasinococcus_capsulatus_cf.AAC.26